MTKWYYANENGKRICVTSVQLQWLVKKGEIRQGTLLENESGETCAAGDVKGLDFPETVSAEISSSHGASPFTPKPIPDDNSTSMLAEKNMKNRSWVVIPVALFLLATGGFITWAMLGTHPLMNTLKEGLNNEVFSKVPLDIANISVEWTEKKADSATGKFSVKAKATENLYKLVDYDAGLQKLDIAGIYEDEFNAAMDKFESLPRQYQEDLRNDTLQDISSFRFYDLLVPDGDEVHLTGSVELVKHASGSWLVGRFLLYPFSCGDDFTAESDLREKEHRLDDPKTKETINTIIRGRKNFVAKVEPAWDQWKRKQREEEEDRRNRLTQQQREKEDRERAELEAEQKRVVQQQQAEQEAERKRVEEMTKERELWRQAALKDQLDNFNEFCKPGIRYKGSFQFRGPNNVASFDAIVVFKDKADENANKADGTISIPYPGGISVRSFSVSVNSREVTEYPVTGMIDNNRLPTLENFGKDAKITTRRGAEDAKAFYGFLRDHTRIDIQFTDEAIFSLASKNGGDRIRIDLSPERGTRPEIKHSVPPDWLNSATVTGAVDLNEEMRKSGFVEDYKPIESFVQYGTKKLQDRLAEEQRYFSNVDAFDKAAAQKRVDAVNSQIKTAQKEIAGMTFFRECVYSTGNVQVHDDRSTCTISINPGFITPQARGGIVSFPVPNISCNLVNQGRSLSGFRFSISGSTDSIQELVRNNHLYRVRIQFTNLRYDGSWAHADLLKIDIFRMGDVRREQREPAIDPSDPRRRARRPSLP